jgi:hypothetical protein
LNTFADFLRLQGKIFVVVETERVHTYLYAIFLRKYFIFIIVAKNKKIVKVTSV